MTEEDFELAQGDVITASGGHNPTFTVRRGGEGVHIEHCFDLEIGLKRVREMVAATNKKRVLTQLKLKTKVVSFTVDIE